MIQAVTAFKCTACGKLHEFNPVFGCCKVTNSFFTTGKQR